jgi:hypothetical protein
MQYIIFNLGYNFRSLSDMSKRIALDLILSHEEKYYSSRTCLKKKVAVWYTE